MSWDPVELFFDAMEAAEAGPNAVDFYDRPSGIVDANAAQIVPALLAAGWTAPKGPVDATVAADCPECLHPVPRAGARGRRSPDGGPWCLCYQPSRPAEAQR